MHGHGIQRNTDACDTSDTTLSFTRRPRSTRRVTFREDASFPAASGVLCYSLPNLWVSLRLWHTLSPSSLSPAALVPLTFVRALCRTVPRVACHAHRWVPLRSMGGAHPFLVCFSAQDSSATLSAGGAPCFHLMCFCVLDVSLPSCVS